MRKWIFIFILAASLVLTGCSRSDSTAILLGNNSNTDNVEVVGSLGYTREKTVYINEDMKALAQDINDLRKKYKDSIDERELDYIYIDIYGNGDQSAKNLLFTNRSAHYNEYFYDLVEILDRSIAEGLKDYVMDMKDKDLLYNEDNTKEIIIKKIGRTVVYVEDRGDKNNYISININFLDIEDDYYREIFNKVSNEKYILDNMVIGEKLNLIDFVNSNQLYNYYYNAKDVKIRYNMFFKDKDIEKVNILMEGRTGAEFSNDDISVFINLLNILDLKEEEKDQLIEEYKNIFERRINSKTNISTDNYNIYINDKKGNSNSGNDWDKVYFSIERK